MNVALVTVSLAYLVFLVGVEGWATFTGAPTISRRLQLWVQDNYQLAIGLGVMAGWFIAHFSGFPG
jgi:hypothetical protein